LSVIISTFLSVSPEHKKKGYGIVLWSELVKRVQGAGFDGMVNFCVEGEPMNGMVVGCARRLGLPIERIFSAHYLSLLLRPTGSRERSSERERANTEEFLQLAAPLSDQAQLARVWSAAEAEWQCARRFGTITARHEAGSRFGILTSYAMEIHRPDRAKCLLIEDVLWGTLASDERQDLLRQLLHNAAAAGVRMATVPVLRYADMEPFIAAGFRPSRRIVHGYLTIWNSETAAESLSSMYLDVF
jgi:hypothetical protein